MLAGICTDCGSTFQNDNQFQLIMPLPCKMPDCKAAVVAGDWKGGSAVDRQFVIGPVRDTLLLFFIFSNFLILS